MAILKVKTKYGWVEGIPACNQAVSLFRGIPYAAPPVGELRWKEPQPPKPWDGVLQAYKFENICWQERRASEGGNDVIGNEFYCLDHPRSEDCLQLNIWTPAIKGDEKLPVGVYFHGGGYSAGYGFLNCYDGEGFAKRDCVLVTVTHRLNVFGFLAHPWLTAEDTEHHSSGNYGALDLVAALKWVNENIAAFGGDPEKVTIFGQSGGGDKTKTMAATPLTKGLVHRAIMQSGGGFRGQNAGNYLADSEAFGIKFFEYMGFKSLEEARAAAPETITQGFIDYTKEYGMVKALQPNVDGYLLPKTQTEIFLAGEHPELDYMIGCTANEFVNDKAKVPSYEEARAYAVKMYGEELADKFLQAVHINEPETAQKMYREYVGLTGETIAGDLAWCENEVNLGRKPTHMYFLTIVPPGAEFAHHSAEHHYVFQTLVRSKRPYTGRDYDLSNQLADYWANFIKTGDPNGSGNPQWDGYTVGNRKAMEINYDLHMTEVPVNDYIKFLVEYDLMK